MMEIDFLDKKKLDFEKNAMEVRNRKEKAFLSDEKKIHS